MGQEEIGVMQSSRFKSRLSASDRFPCSIVLFTGSRKACRCASLKTTVFSACTAACFV